MLCFGKTWICQSRTLDSWVYSGASRGRSVVYMKLGHRCFSVFFNTPISPFFSSIFLRPSHLSSFFHFNFVSVRQLHREFQRAGADVMQAFTFSLDDDLEGDQAKYGVRMTISKCLSDQYTMSRDSEISLKLIPNLNGISIGNWFYHSDHFGRKNLCGLMNRNIRWYLPREYFQFGFVHSNKLLN